MTARPPIAQFGDAIPSDGERPAWLPDGVDFEVRWKYDVAPVGVFQAWDVDHAWDIITAIRLEVPRYDFVYLALERGMVPWFGGDEAPGDWDGSEVLMRGDVMFDMECFAENDFMWRHDTGSDDIIGYHATSTALPLAHAAAPQGEDDVHIKRIIAAAKRVVADYPAAAGAYPDIEGGDSKPGWGSIRSLAEALTALAPAAIASGRGEGE